MTRAFMHTALPADLTFTEITEIPGAGISAKDKQGNRYRIGSGKFTLQQSRDEFHVHVVKNDVLMAALEFEDTIKAEAAGTINYFKQNGVKTVLLSGDRDSICKDIGEKLKMDDIFSEKLPADKVEIIRSLQSKGKVAMAGDGINDAPSLALASVGISMKKGSQITKQTADVVLVNNRELHSLTHLHQLSKGTMRTIRQNLIWALIYNIVAIPMAAAGFLSPVLASLSMAFSDVVVIGNSIRLRYRKIPDLK